MTTQRPDDDLHAAFQAKRAAERRRVPPYAAVASRRRRPARGAPWLLLSVLAAVLVAIGLAYRSGSSGDLELARQVMESASPTVSLFPASALSLLDFIPRIGISVPGSPLRALDPGGPLGPPLTRSPRI